MGRFHYEVGYLTHPGNLRPVNQDSLLIRRGSVEGREFLLLAVADGMGGLARGELASALAAGRLDSWWTDQLGDMVSPNMDWSRLEGSLRAVVEAIHWAIYSGTSEGEARSGTTLSLVFLYQGEYRLLHVGDSRIYQLGRSRLYQLGRSRLYQLTRDQTWCQQEMDAGRLGPEEAVNHPMRHVLISTLGAAAHGYVLERRAGRLTAGGLLLCSDGFYQELPVLWPGPQWEKRSPQELLEEAATQILNGSARDNLSAILVRVSKRWR